MKRAAAFATRSAERGRVATDARRSLPYVRLLGAQLAIGGAAIFARFALGGAQPVVVSALRLSIAAAIVIAFARKFERLSLRRELAFAAAGIALALHFVAWFASLVFTSVAVSTLLVTTTPIWTESFDCIRERRVPGRVFLIALAGCLAGIAAIVSRQVALPRRAGLPQPAEAAGAGLAIAGSLAIGVYLLIVRDAGASPGSRRRLETSTIVSRTYAWAAVVLVLASLVTASAPPPPSNVAAWGGILAMALVSQLLGHTALNAALRDFTPSVVAISTLLEAPIAAGFAALIFKETLSLQAALGGLLVLGSVGLILRGTPSANLVDGVAADERL